MLVTDSETYRDQMLASALVSLTLGPILAAIKLNTGMVRATDHMSLQGCNDLASGMTIDGSKGLSAFLPFLPFYTSAFPHCLSALPAVSVAETARVFGDMLQFPRLPVVVTACHDVPCV